MAWIVTKNVSVPIKSGQRELTAGTELSEADINALPRGAVRSLKATRVLEFVHDDLLPVAPKPEKTIEKTPEVPPPAPEPKPVAWQSTEIKSLGLKQPTVKVLSGLGLKTVADVLAHGEANAGISELSESQEKELRNAIASLAKN